MKYILYFRIIRSFKNNVPQKTYLYDSFDELKNDLDRILKIFISTEEQLLEYVRIKAINLEFDEIYRTKLGDFFIAKE